MTDAGNKATEQALNDAAKKEEERIKAEEADAAAKKAAAEAEAKKPKELTKEEKELQAKVAQDKKEHDEKVAKRKVETDAVHKKIEAILKKYGGMESNIGIGHEYWGLQNELRRLHNEPL